MSGREDTRLVDHLYGELSEKEAREYRRALDEDPALAPEAEALESFEETLGLMRGLEDEEPPAHLDSLVLAHAREEATKLAESGAGFRGLLKKIFRSPAIGLAVAGSVAAVFAVVTISVPMQRAMNESAPARAPLQVEMPAPQAEMAAKLEPPPPPAEKAIEEEAQAAAAEGGELEAAQAPKKKLARREAKKPAEDPSAGNEMFGGVGASAGAGLDQPANRGPAAGRAADRAEKDRDEERVEDLKLSEDRADDSVVAKETTRSKAVTPPAQRPQATVTEPASEAPPEAPATTTTPAPVVGGAMIDRESAARYAQDVIRAAETQLGLKDRVGARNILTNGLAQTRGTPAYGDIMLRIALLDYEEGKLADAARNARIAANVPSFARKGAAQELLSRVERAVAAESERAKASRAAPTSADTYESR